MTSAMIPPLLIALALGYVLGSIPFGLLLTRAAGLGDVREIGSKSIGATNVLRTGNKKIAALTLLFDLLKGTSAVLVGMLVAGKLASAFVGPPNGVLVFFLVPWFAGLGAIVGHNYPVWLGFKGGKGVAVMIGSLLTLSWPVGLIFCAVWLLIAFTRKLSSLAALTAAATAPIFAYVVVDEWLAATAALLAILLFYQHRENIARLIAGTEPKIGSEKKAS